MQKIRPCLWFDGQVEEAIAFYLSIFKDGEMLEMMRKGETGPGPAGEPLTAAIRLQDQEIMFLNGGSHQKLTPAFSLSVSCKDQAEVDYYWNALTEGGEEMDCAWLKDKFGVCWQIVPEILPRLLQDPDKEKAARAMQAMMTMQKIDIAR